MFAKQDFIESLGGLSAVVSGVVGQRLRVRRLVFVSAAAGSFKLVSNPAGTPSDLTSLLHCAANKPIELIFRAEDGVVGGLSEGLGVNVSAFGFTADYSVSLWYERV